MIALRHNATSTRRRHANNYYVLGQQCAEEGAVEQARAHLRRALTYDAAFVPALRVLANLEYSEQNFAVARELLNTALAAAPDDIELHFLLGGLELGEGHPDAALAAYQQVADLGDDSPELYFNVGLAHLFTGQPQAALDALTILIDRHPDHQRGWDALGCARRMLHDNDGAMQAFLRALEIDPTLNDARDHLAQLMIESGHPQHACPVLEVALHIEPERYSSRHLMGVALAMMLRYEEAIACWDANIAAGGATAETYHLLANAYLHLARPEMAISALETLLTLAPTYASAHLQLALLVLEHHDDAARAKRHLEQARSLDPQNPTIQNVLAATEAVLLSRT